MIYECNALLTFKLLTSIFDLSLGYQLPTNFGSSLLLFYLQSLQVHPVENKSSQTPATSITTSNLQCLQNLSHNPTYCYKRLQVSTTVQETFHIAKLLYRQQQGKLLKLFRLSKMCKLLSPG